jgi:hypothetical protein
MTDDLRTFLKSGRLFASFPERKGNQIPILFIRCRAKQFPAIDLGEGFFQKEEVITPDLYSHSGFFTVNLYPLDFKAPDPKIFAPAFFQMNEGGYEILGKIIRVLEKAGDYVPNVIIPDVFLQEGLIEGLYPGFQIFGTGLGPDGKEEEKNREEKDLKNPDDFEGGSPEWKGRNYRRGAEGFICSAHSLMMNRKNSPRRTGNGLLPRCSGSGRENRRGVSEPGGIGTWDRQSRSPQPWS